MSFNAEKQGSRDGRAGSMNPPPVSVGLAPRASRPMRGSGVEWIGQLPEGWRVSAIRHHYKITLGKMLCSSKLGDQDTLEKYFCAANVHFDGGVDAANLKEMWFSPEEKEVYKVEPGDLLVVEGGAGAGGAAIVGELPFDSYIQNSILIVRGRSAVDNAYAGYLLEVLVKSGYVDYVSNKATIPHFTKEKVGSVPLPLPPESELQGIVKFLNTRCGEIDAAVAVARQSIEDYKALKKSLVFEAVTGKKVVQSRGDDEWSRGEGRVPTRPHDDERSRGDYERSCGEGRVPTRPHDDERSRGDYERSCGEGRVPTRPNDNERSCGDYERSCGSTTLPAGGETAMRDSGVAWIGAVPEGWRVERLKFLLRQPLQYGASESGVEFCDDLPRYIRITDITLDGKLKEDGKLSLTKDQSEGYLLDDRDILLARSGATVGKAFIYRASYGRAAFAGYLIRAQINDKIALPEFVAYTMQSSGYDDWKNSIAVSATIQNIGADKYNEYKFPLPPLPEQRAIADYLDEKCGAIDALVAEKESLIADLEQYKKSLIFECVTGKREVA